MRPENIKKWIKDTNIDTNAKMDEVVLDDILKALEQSKKQTAAKQPSIWRTIMKRKITKLATAAVIIIAVMIGINQFGGSFDGASVAWGKLAEKIEQIETVSYRMQSSTKTDNATTEALIRQSSQYGMRMDSFQENKLSRQMYTLLEEKIIIVILPEEKKYFRKELTEEQLQGPKIEDPRKWLKSLLSGKYQKLGRNVIDEVEVEGIEVEKPQFMGGALADCRVQLWVDIENELPVRLVVETIPSGKKWDFKTVFDNFQWDIELDSSVFEPPAIPDDYTEWEVPKQWESRKKTGN